MPVCGFGMWLKRKQAWVTAIGQRVGSAISGQWIAECNIMVLAMEGMVWVIHYFRWAFDFDVMVVFHPVAPLNLNNGYSLSCLLFIVLAHLLLVDVDVSRNLLK